MFVLAAFVIVIDRWSRWSNAAPVWRPVAAETRT
jgi:hypothetical protein